MLMVVVMINCMTCKASWTVCSCVGPRGRNGKRYKPPGEFYVPERTVSDAFRTQTRGALESRHRTLFCPQRKQLRRPAEIGGNRVQLPTTRWSSVWLRNLLR